MSELAHLAYMMENTFSNPKGGAFAHFVVVTDQLRAEQAAQSPAPRINSVWAIVNHVAFWQDALHQALKGEPIELTSWGLTEVGAGWPPLGEVSDDRWLAARQRALEVNRALSQTIKEFDERALKLPLEHFFGAPTYRAIYSIFAHNCYHIAEITSTRHMLGYWVEDPLV